MARGRSTNYKKPKGSWKRKKPRYGEEEEDDDDDYVLGNDEESESSFESNGGDSSSEESFDFSGSDEVEVEAAAASKPRKKPRGSRERTTVSAKRTISRVLDLEEEDYSHSDDDDEDFKPNEEEDDDNDEETHAIAGRNRRSAVKIPQNQHRKKRKPKKRKTRNPAAVTTKTKRRRAAPRSDEDDDDFTVKDLVVADNSRKNRKKARRKRNKRFSADSGSSDSDFVDSDDDFVASDPDLVVSDDDDFVVKDRVTVSKKRKRGNKISRKKKKKTSSRTTTKKKKKLQVSDSSDSDYVIPEDEVRDLVIGGNGIVNQQQPKRIFAGRKGEQKAKVKEADVIEKQVCGVCLSEEQQTAIQGVLNCCNHYFCFACIMEWSKVESRCPLCKRRFTTITKPMRSDQGFGVRGAVIRVQKRDQVYQPSEEEIRGYIDPYENVVCMVCQEGGHDNFMLLCDICDSPAHTFCVGLGREVPEGNWYCEGCRSTGEGSSNSQGQTIVVDQGTSNSDSFSVALEPEGLSTNPHTNTNPRQSPSTPVRNRFDLNVPSRHLTEYSNGMSSPLGRPATHRHANTNSPGQSSPQGFDLNLPPGHLLREDHGVGSQASGVGASTLFGRRAIHQRIRILLSGNRPSDMLSRAAVPRPNGEVATLEVGQGVGSCPVLHSNPNLAPCMFGEGSSFRHVEGAKEQVASMVNSDLKILSMDNQLERGHFKHIARRCTHTILAACGIDHRRSLVDPTSVQSLKDCSHGFTDEGHTTLLKGHCPPCFRSFVTSVVRKLMNNTTHER